MYLFCSLPHPPYYLGNFIVIFVVIVVCWGGVTCPMMLSLLLALHSGIPPGDAHGTMWVARD